MISKQNGMILYLLVVLCALGSAEAFAIEFQAGGGLKGGGGSLTLSEGTNIKSPPFGWGMGVNVFAGIKPLPIFSLGVNFDYVHYWHEDTSTNQRTNGSLPSIGFYARGGGVDSSKPGATTGIGFGAWANYVFGSITALVPSALDPTSSRIDDLDLSGWQFGAQAFYQFRPSKFKTYVELGAYITYNTLASEIEQPGTIAGSTVITKYDASYFTIGALLQVTFEFGKPGF